MTELENNSIIIPFVVAGTSKIKGPFVHPHISVALSDAVVRSRTAEMLGFFFSLEFFRRSLAVGYARVRSVSPCYWAPGADFLFNMISQSWIFSPPKKARAGWSARKDLGRESRSWT